MTKTIDRSVAPPFKAIDDVPFQELVTVLLGNGLPLHVIDAGTQEVVRIDLVCDAGSYYAPRNLVASYTARMLTEGTNKLTARELADRVEFYGASLQAEADRDELIITLHTLTKHLPSVLPILTDVCTEPSFPEENLRNVLNTGKQELLVNRQKVGHLARDRFFSGLFGQNHPYGRTTNPEDYDSLSREMLVQHHARFVYGHVKYAMVSGRLSDEIVREVAGALGQLPNQFDGSYGQFEFSPIPILNSEHVEFPGAVQNALRVGRLLFDRTHPDYADLSVLTTVLGGYFGSRLMTNLREDKGYTYGISAQLQSYKHSGLLSISTEVGADVCGPALNEIFREIAKLRQEPIGNHELILVRNYLMGQMLNGVDGPFNLAAKWRSYLRHGLSTEHHHRYISRLLEVTPIRLQELANTYLTEDELITITAGKSDLGN